MQREIVTIGSSEQNKVDLLTDLKKKLLESETPITSNDLDEYVKIIINKLKAIKKEERGSFLDRIASLFSSEKKIKEKKFYLIDELDENEISLEAQDITLEDVEKSTSSSKIAALKKEKNFDEDLFVEQRQAVSRIKQAFIEKLKDAIVQEKALNDLNYSDLQFTKTTTESSGKLINRDVKLQRDFNEHESVLRSLDRSEISQQLNAADKYFFELGKKIISELPANPYLVRIEASSKNKEIVERLHLTDIAKESKKTGAEPTLLLKAFRDAVRGGLFLEENGLVLQDISLDNLGIKDKDTNDQQGVLFDLDFVVPEGSPVSTRVAKLENAIPSNFVEGNRASSSEMVFQFGRSLGALRRNLQKANPNFSSSLLREIRTISDYATNPAQVYSEEKGRIVTILPDLRNMEKALDNLTVRLEKGDVETYDRAVEGGV